MSANAMRRFDEVTEQKFYVHYTADNMNPPRNMVAGPYSETEVLAQRRDIAGYAGIKNVYVSESSERAE